MYVIRHPEGKLSKGGIRPTYSVAGKSWTTLAAIAGHLAQSNKIADQYIADDCTLVQIDLVGMTMKSMPFYLWYEMYKLNKQLKKAVTHLDKQQIKEQISAIEKSVSTGECF